MSLALYASPFNNSENNNNNPDPIENKRKQRRQTQKRRPSQVSKLKESMISGMNNDDEHLTDWNPPPKSESVGVKKPNAKVFNFALKINFIPLKELFNKSFLQGGVRRGYADFEGNSVTDLAEDGEYDIEAYIKKKDLEFSKARNGYKGIVSVLGNYDFKELSERREFN